MLGGIDQHAPAEAGAGADQAARVNAKPPHSVSFKLSTMMRVVYILIVKYRNSKVVVDSQQLFWSLRK